MMIGVDSWQSSPLASPTPPTAGLPGPLSESPLAMFTTLPTLIPSLLTSLQSYPSSQPTIPSAATSTSFYDIAALNAHVLSPPNDTFFKNLYKKYATVATQSSNSLSSNSLSSPLNPSSSPSSPQLTYRNFVKLCTHTHLYPTIANCASSNFLLTRIFVAGSSDPSSTSAQIASQLSANSNLAGTTRSTHLAKLARDAAEREMDEGEGDASFSHIPRSARLSTSKKHSRSAGKGATHREHHAQGVPQQTLGQVTAKLETAFTNFELDHELNEQRELSSEQPSPSPLLYLTSHPQVLRSLLHSCGENPFPGEFQLFLALLKNAATTHATSHAAKRSQRYSVASGAQHDKEATTTDAATTGLPSATASSSPGQAGGSHGFGQSWSLSTFLTSYQTSSFLSRQTQTIALTYPQFVTTIAIAATLVAPASARNIKDCVAHIVAGMIAAVKASTPQSHAHLSLETPGTPKDGHGSEQYEDVEDEYSRMLERVFFRYVKKCGASDAVITVDTFRVFFRDTKLFPKITEKLLEGVLTTFLGVGRGGVIDGGVFMEICGVLGKENYFRQAQSAPPQPVTVTVRNGSTNATLPTGWCQRTKHEDHKRITSRLEVLFEVYKLPVRGAGQTRKMKEESTRSNGQTTQTQPRQAQYIDFWSGEAVKSGGEEGDGGNYVGQRAGARNNLLTLIMDTSQAKKEETAHGDSPDDAALHIDTVAAPTFSELGTLQSNLGNSIFDVAHRSSAAAAHVAEAAAEAARLPSPATVPSPQHHTKAVATTVFASVNKERDTTSDTATDPKRDLQPRPPDMGGAHTTRTFTKRVFKKSFGLSRGVTKFKPRMTTSNRERLKYQKVLSKTCKLIAMHTDTLRKARGATETPDNQAVTWNGEMTFLTEDAGNVHAHPSYRLYEEGVRMAQRRPMHAIALWEKALVFAVSLSPSAGGVLKMKIYEAIVSVAVGVGKLQQAADLMEDHLDLIREYSTDRTVEVKVLNQLGKTHYEMGNYEDSEAVHSQQQALAHQIFDHLGEMRAFYGMGLALWKEKHLEEAKDMFKNYCDLAEEFCEEREVALAGGMLGGVNEELGLYSEAFVSFKKQISKLRDILSEAPADKAVVMSLCMAFGNLGNVYRKWGKLPLCFNAVSKQLKLATDLKSIKSECESRYALSGVILEMRTGVGLEAFPKLFYGGGSAELMFEEYCWSASGWSGQYKIIKLFTETSEGDREGLHDIFEEVLRHLDFCLENVGSGARGEEMLWNCMCDYGSIMFLMGKKEDGSGFYRRCMLLLEEIEKRYEEDEKGDGMSEELEDKIHMKKLQVCLFEGVYKVLYKDWAGALEQLEAVAGGLAKGGDELHHLAVAKCLIGWCQLNLNRRKEALDVFESAGKCYDILRDELGRCFAKMALGDMWEDEGKGAAWGMEYYGSVFKIGGSEDLVEVQIASLGKLSDLHESEGEIDVSMDLARRAFNLRGLLDHNLGRGEAEAKLASKTMQSVESSVVWMDADGVDDLLSGRGT